MRGLCAGGSVVGSRGYLLGCLIALTLFSLWLGSYLWMRPAGAPVYTPRVAPVAAGSSMPIRVSSLGNRYWMFYYHLGLPGKILYYLHVPLNAIDRHLLGNPVKMELDIMYFDFGAQF